MTNFGEIKDYKPYVEQDPFRNGLHYPAVLQKLGNLRRRILDAGCGDGRFPRRMAEQGAQVTGYDRSPERIEEALAEEAKHPLGIQYHVATPQTFAEDEHFQEPTFDDATSVLFLPYAPSVDELRAFFRSTTQQLLEERRFISVIFNPLFSAFGKDLGSRRFTKLKGNDVQVEFIEPSSHTTQFTSVLHQYTREEYEQAAVEGGLQPDVWEKLYATREAIEQMGEPFWEDCHKEQPYALFVARR